MELEIRHLTALCAIADAGSISKAAMRLGMSQPALTAQLKRIESELGAVLFVRNRSGATPTAIGDAVLARARTALLAITDLRRATGGVTPAARPVVRVGGVAGPVAIGIADRVSDLLPDAEVHLRTEYSSRVLWELLTADQLDLAVLVDYPDFELSPPMTMLSQVIAVEPALLALSERHRLACRERVDLADLAEESWVLTPSDGMGWPDCLYSACERSGFTPKVPFIVGEGSPLLQMVATGRAVGLRPTASMRFEGIVLRRLVDDPIHLRYVLVGSPHSAVAGIFQRVAWIAGEAYRKHVQRLPDSLRWAMAENPGVTVRGTSPSGG